MLFLPFKLPKTRFQKISSVKYSENYEKILLLDNFFCIMLARKIIDCITPVCLCLGLGSINRLGERN